MSPPSILRSLQIHFFSTHTATTEIYTLSLHDALPIYHGSPSNHRGARQADRQHQAAQRPEQRQPPRRAPLLDRKSTRLNSSHVSISYAVFCLKKKNTSTVNSLQYIGGQTVVRIVPRPT